MIDVFMQAVAKSQKVDKKRNHLYQKKNTKQFSC